MSDYLNDWGSLPDFYKEKFAGILKERGLTDQFDSLPDPEKKQILEIIRQVMEQMYGDQTNRGQDE